MQTIIKRDGTKEPFNADKVNGWSEWASKKLGKKVDWSEVVINTISTLPNECTSRELQESLIRYCLGKNTWEYNLMAGRLYASLLVRIIHNSSTYPTVKEVQEKMYKDGVMIKLDYSDEDYKQIEKIIDHSLNLTYPHYSLHQNRKKYSLCNLVTKEEYETSQFMYMRMAMARCEKEPKDKRIAEIKEAYEVLSKHQYNCPTPFYVNLGTKLKGYASCCVIDSNDRAKSLAVADHITYMMTVMSAGIGYHIRTRSLGDGVRGGVIEHQGKLPYIRSHVSATRANKQCYAVGTNILTKDGYIDFKDVTKEHLVAQFDSEKNETTYINPMDVIAYHHKGEMVEFLDQDGNVISKVTPNHRVVYKRDGDETIYVNLAENLDDLTDIVFIGLKEYRNVTKRVVQYDDMVYCVTVPTGMLKVEYNGHHLISGNSSRGGATTVYYNLYDPEIATLTKLKNPITPLTKQIREADYSFGSNRLIVEKASRNEDVALFSHQHNEELYEAIYSGDPDYFERLYNEFLESDKPRTMVSARKILSNALNEQFDTGRMYEHFIDAMNTHTPFYDPIYSSNLCLTGDTILDVKIKDKESQMTLKEVVDSKIKTIYVKSYNIDSKRIEYKLITDKGLTAKDASLMKIDTQTERQIRCTTNHKIYTLNRGYVEAGQLVQEDSLLLDNETPAHGFIEHLTTTEDVYDITVEDNHNFFANGILVHNCQEINLPTAGFEDMMELYSPYDEEKNHIVVKAQGTEKAYKVYNYAKVESSRGSIYALKLQKGDEFILPESDIKIKIEDVLNRNKAGEIGLCNVGGVIVSNLPEDDFENAYEKVCRQALKFVHFGIHGSDYVFKNLEETAKARMSAGIGIVGLAHLMAKKGLKYSSQEGKNFIHELAETHYWHLANTALELTEDYGVAKWMYKTKWLDGWTPLSTYNKNVDSLVTVGTKRDWEGFSKKVVANGGLAFSVLACMLPSESSSISGGTTNGVYPIRSLTLNKTNDTLSLSYVVPDATKLKDEYEFAWGIETRHIIDLYSILQKWTDQGISADYWHDISGNVKVSGKQMLRDYFLRFKFGHKGKYYNNTLTSKKGLLNETQEDECESCTI